MNYVDTYRKLSIYENKISSLNTELNLLKKENTLLHDQLQVNQVHIFNNKEIASRGHTRIKESNIHHQRRST